MTEQLLSLPGFLYDVGGDFYYLGKWICKKCEDTSASDCIPMYHMCRENNEEPDTIMYFHKIRAFSDFALDIPYNPEKIKTDIQTLISGLSDAQKTRLNEQIKMFTEDLARYGSTA